MSIIKDLEWRYATKRMTSEVVTDDKVKTILKSIQLAPTSMGLQPFEVKIITNQELKNKIKEAAYNQPIVSECSHLLVLSAWKTYDVDKIKSYFTHFEKERGFEKGHSNTYRDRIIGQLSAMPSDQQFEHAAKQVYIALGFALAEAAKLKVDSLPMEGFIPDKVDEILNHSSENLQTVLLMPIGYRDLENDKQIHLKKVRKPFNETFSFIK